MNHLLQESESKIDVDDFDRNLREILFELQRKRTLLDDCRKELNESVLKHEDLERQLINEKNQNTNDDYQNVILRNAAQALEEERQKCSKELIKLKVQLELSVAERDSLRNQVRSQCLEINNLKRQVDDLHSKHRCHDGFQKDITEQLSKIKVSVSQVNDLIVTLRKKQEELGNISKTISVADQLFSSAKQFEKQKKVIEKERDEMEKKITSKSAELSKLNQLLNDSTIMFKPFENHVILNYWKGTCNNLKTQLKLEKDGTEKLINTLKLSHENEQHLRRKLIKNEERIAELEKNLQKYANVNIADTETQTSEHIIEIVDLVKSETLDSQ